MTEVPEHLLRRSKERRAALGLATGGDDAPAPAATSSAPAVAEASAAPAAARTAAAPAEPAGPVPSIGIPVQSRRDPVRTRTRVPLWAMPVLALLPFWAFLYAGAFGDEAGAGEEGAGSGAITVVEGEPPAGAKTVDVVNNAFEPASISAKVGETIAWTWAEAGGHNITGGPLESPTQASGSYAVTFEEATTISYECTIHPGMEGEVVIEA